MKIIRHTYLNAGLIIVMFAILFQLLNIRSIQKDKFNGTIRNTYSVETFRTGESGWGYSIKCGEKIVIKQDIIPAIQQSVPFHSENDAKKTANLVIHKLNLKKIPAISVNELDSLQVFY
jgi:hypothetical protein